MRDVNPDSPIPPVGQGAPVAAGAVLDLAEVALLVLDADLRVVELNSRARLLVDGEGDPLGQRLCPDRVGADLCARLERARASGAESTFEVACALPGAPGWCRVRCVPTAEGLVVVVHDLTDVRRSEELRRSVIETAPDGIIVIDARGIIDSANPAIERLFGYASDELEGRNVSVLMPEPFHSEHDGYIERYLRTGEAQIIGRGREVVGRRKDGSDFPIQLSVGEMVVGGERMFTGIVSDLSEHRRVEEELRRIELRSRVLAEQAALRRVATAVARESSPRRIFDLVAEEVARHLSVPTALVCRFEGRAARIVGTHSTGGRIRTRSVPLTSEGPLMMLARAGVPVRVDDLTVLDPILAGVSGTPLRGSVAAPIRTAAGVWGAIIAGTSTGTGLVPGAERDLFDFAELVAMAVANAADRARLEDLAATDPLTGLANHRTFHERLRAEVARARRHGMPLSLAMIDIDRFKRINDEHGHAVGDEVLREVASRLRASVREGEVIARVGGEEFAWILPETDAAGAVEAAERVRRAVCEASFATVGTVTVSGGVCDLSRAGDATQLLLFADGALYWAKRHGRNVVCDYEQGALDPLSPLEHVARLESAEALTSMRALARVVDAKDPTTNEHSTRVAEMAVRLATALEWSPDRVARLHEAGLLHDIGKIGVPDAILFKPDRLTPEEYEVVKGHAALSEHIITGIVTDEQARWVRHHHERHDGRGYPDGLSGHDIPDGARILALADAWDVMLSERPYHRRPPFTVPEALAECRREAGRQFDPWVVDALVALVQASAATGPGPSPEDED